MKKNFKRIVAGVLALTLAITGLSVDWNRGSEVEAADTLTGVEPVTLEGFKHVTISDFGNNSIESLTDKTYGQEDAANCWLTSGAGTFNNTLVSMRVTFGEGKELAEGHLNGATTGFHIAGSVNGGGFVVFVSNDGQTLGLQDAVDSGDNNLTGRYRYREVYSADIAGVDSFLKQEFLLQMSFEYVNERQGYPGNDETKAVTTIHDVKIGMYINGKLYNNEKTVIEACRKEKMGAHLDLRLTADTSSLSLASVTAKPLSQFAHVTLSDFGNNTIQSLTDKTYVNGESAGYWLTSGAGTLKDTIVSMKVKYGTGGKNTGFCIANTGSSVGFLVYVEEDGSKLHLYDLQESSSSNMTGVYRKDVIFDATTAGLTSFLNTEFLLQMSFEYENERQGYPGNDETKAETTIHDVKVGMYINGKLYNNEKTVIEACRKEKFGSHLDLRLEASDSSLYLSSVKAEPTPVYVDGFTHLTIDSFGNSSLTSMTDKTYDQSSSGRYWLTTGAGTLNNTVVSMKVKFSAGKDWSNTSPNAPAQLFVASSSSSNGLVLTVSNDGQYLGIQAGIDSSGSNLTGKYRERLNYSKDDVGISSFLDQEFLLQLSFEYENERTGYPGDNTGLTQTTVHDIRLGVYINGILYNNEKTLLSACRKDLTGSSISVGCDATSTLSLATIDVETHHDLSDGAYSYVDGAMALVNQKQRVGIYLDKPGDYNLQVGTAQTTKKVITYLEGDVNIDGAVDVRDIIAGKKALQTTPETKAAKLGMDMDRDDKLTATDIGKIRTFLVTGANESISYIGEGVMPIAGFWGPTNQFVNNEMFQKIADMGMNLISHTALDYKSSPELVKKYLTLADKHKIGVFVTDSNVTDKANGTAVKKSEIAQALAEYRNYPAFCGMYLVDEPHTDYYGQNGSGVLVSQLGSLAKVLQKDFDLTCYANLFGMGSSKADGENAYERYVKEFCETVRPKVLMWDYYVYSGNSTVSQYFENMSIIRKYAEQYNIPFWSFIQAGNDWNTDKSSTEGYFYSPNQSEFEWNVNTSLAFGAKGIQYFPLIQPGSFYADCKDYRQNGLIGADGNTNQWYGYAKKMNTQIAAVDEVLMNSVNKGIILSGSASAVSAETSEYLIPSGSFQALQSVSGDCLVGCFNYQGKTALYVVNYSTDAKTNVTLALNKTYTVTTVQNANSSSEQTNNITLDMAAGEGVLLVIQ